MQNVHLHTKKADLAEREMKDCTFHPDLGSVETLNKLAKRAETRHIAEQNAEPAPQVEDSNADAEEQEKLRKERKNAEKKRHRREFKVPFKRETYNPIDLLIRSRGKA
jgi:hypothetical protein